MILNVFPNILWRYMIMKCISHYFNNFKNSFSILWCLFLISSELGCLFPWYHGLRLITKITCLYIKTTSPFKIFFLFFVFVWKPQPQIQGNKYEDSRFKPRSAEYKANTLPTVLSLWPRLCSFIHWKISTLVKSTVCS